MSNRNPVYTEAVADQKDPVRWSLSALELAVDEADLDPLSPVSGPYSGLPIRPRMDGPVDIQLRSLRGLSALDMRRWSASVAFLATMAAGVLLVCFSLIVKAAFVEAEIPVDPGLRETGFIWSPLWSIGELECRQH